MKYEWKLSVGASLFLGVVALIYWFLSYEDAGTVMLVFSFAAYGMLGAFLLMEWKKRKNIPRPEDNPDGTYADGAGEIAFFPAASIWPAGIGLGAIFIVLALIWGNWYWLIGLPLVFGSIIGLTVEAEAPEDRQLHSEETTGEYLRAEAIRNGTLPDTPEHGAAHH
jgi:membrane associated rhomboid family serine protease